MASSTSASGRLAIIDVARGVAIVAMAIYHAGLDLSRPEYGGFYGLIGLHPLESPFVWLARITAGSFLFLVGVSLVLAHRRGINFAKFGRRLAILVGAAALVSIATYFVVPDAWVRFGILHSIAAASVVGLLFLRLPLVVVLAAAIFAYVAPSLLADPMFNHPAWVWLGLSTEVPPMFDYVPLLPWFSAPLLGIFAARLALRLRFDETLARWQPTSFLPRVLAGAGRWSLVIYLVHQPILLGLFYLLALAMGRAPAFAF